MAEAESPEKTTVNIRMTETFLSDVDGTWKEEGYNSRSEFIRDVLRDAIKHPDFKRKPRRIPRPTVGGVEADTL